MNLSQILMVVVPTITAVGLLVAIVFLIFYKKDKPKKPKKKEIEKARKEYVEEVKSEVLDSLKDIVRKNGGYIFSKYRIELTKNNSKEIDHILIYKGGLFVISDKVDKGSVKGYSTDLTWEITNENHEIDVKPNPVIQNKRNMETIYRLLTKNRPENIYGLVIYPYADLKGVKGVNNVFNIDDAVNFILDKMNENDLSTKEVEYIHQDLMAIKLKYGVTETHHSNNQKRKKLNDE